MLIKIKDIILILMMCFMVWSCSERKHMYNDKNKSKTRGGNINHSLWFNEIKLSEQSSRKQILSDWGPPDDIIGPFFECWVYEMAEDQIWLSFSWDEPYLLLKAELKSVNEKKSQTLFERIDKTRLMDKNKPSKQYVEGEPITYIFSPNIKQRRLRLGDIQLNDQLSRVNVLIAWGLPNAITGSGLEYWNYKLDNGQWLTLLFSQQEKRLLLTAAICDDILTDFEEVLFERKEGEN